MTETPKVKYPVDYKVTHIYDISDKLKSLGLDITNLCPDTKTKNKYHDFNLHDFINKKIQKDNTIYPKIRMRDIFDDDYREFSDRGGVILLPAHYDSSEDDKIYKEEKENGRNMLIELFKELYSGEKLKAMIESMDKNVDFGQSNFEWANIALTEIYKIYKEHYVSDYLRVWYPHDLDSDNSFIDNKKEDTSHGYPICKMLFLSEIEKYLETNYGLSDDLFYQFIIYNTYNEGRYWEKPIQVSFDENFKFIREGGKYGMDATPTIDKMLSILEMEYIDLLKENDKGGECLHIYVDYYKKIETKY